MINAIYKLYPNVVRTVGDKAFDANGNQVTYDLIAVTNQANLDACKAQAQSLLQATDWVEIPSVSNTANTPHLTNVADFIAYRNAVRVLAIHPVASPTFPTIPTESWSS